MEMSITANDANQLSQKCQDFLAISEIQRRKEELARLLITILIEKEIKRRICLGENSCIIDLKLDNDRDTYDIVNIIIRILEKNGYKTETVYHTQRWYKLGIYW